MENTAAFVERKIKLGRIVEKKNNKMKQREENTSRLLRGKNKVRKNKSVKQLKGNTSASV